MIRLMFVFGTRPEAIKLCPVVRYLKDSGGPFETKVCVTAQHRLLLDQVLEVFEITPDWDLDLMTPGQSLCESSARILQGMERVLRAENPQMVIVQGDTTTTFCGALAAFYERIPVAHVEAGLRTGDMSQPFPEELNRVLTTRATTLHFAATADAAQNLAAEGVSPRNVVITGNTGIDALLFIAERIRDGGVHVPSPMPDTGSRKLILVTAHRRESFGEGLDSVCQALLRVARRPDVHILYAVHPNPRVRASVDRWLQNEPNISLSEPLDYVSFVEAMRTAHLIITDSGGIQEEAPSLGKAVLVLRNSTERPEAVAAGSARLVGTEQSRIVEAVSDLLDSPEAYSQMAQVRHVFGDGQASRRIRTALLEFFGGKANN